MPALTTIGLVSGGLALAGGIGKSISAGKQKRKLEKQLDSYQRQELRNPYEGLRVSTLGAVNRQQQAAQNTATALYNLRQGGAGALTGGVGRLVGQSNLVNRDIAAGLDQQMQRNEILQAQGAARVIQQQERREEQDLAGLGQGINVAQQNLWGGFTDIARSAGSFAGALGQAGAFGGGGGTGGGGTGGLGSIGSTQSAAPLTTGFGYTGVSNPQISNFGVPPSQFGNQSSFGAFNSQFQF